MLEATKQSQRSSTSSAHLKAEAELAALAMKKKLLEEKHALEEEDEWLHTRREKLQLDADIAGKTAKLEILKTHRITSGQGT